MSSLLKDRVPADILKYGRNIVDKETSKSRLLLNISAKVGCRICTCHTDGGFIYPTGDMNAKVMIITSPPTTCEGQNHTPLSDDGGVFLSVLLESLKVKRNSLYITTISKCVTNNEAVILNCATRFVSQEIEEVKPNLIITLGEVSAVTMELIENGKDFDYNFSDLREGKHMFKGIDMIHILDPNYVMQQNNMMFASLKSQLWKELVVAFKQIDN